MANKSFKSYALHAAVSTACCVAFGSASWAASIPNLTAVTSDGINAEGDAALVTLTWESVDGANVIYEIGLNTTGANLDGTYSFVDFNAGSSTSYQFTDLDLDSDYRFSVRSVEGDNESSWSSDHKTVHTDSDPDNDGILTSVECPGFTNCPDTDQDGTPNHEDADDDNDGIATADEYLAEDASVLDQDTDTIPDYLEPNNIDTDNDGFTNHLDADDDGDSVLTADEAGDILTPSDADNDDIYDYLDWATAGINDSDSDGLTDTQECNLTPFCTNDSDSDGLTDYLDNSDDTVVPTAVEDTDTGLRTGIDGAGGGSLGLGMLAGMMGLGAVRRRKKRLNKALPVAVAAALTAGVPMSAQAGETQWYIGMGLGASVLDPDTTGIAGVDVRDDQSTGGKLFAGYDFTNHWTLEGFVADLGESELSDGFDVGYELFGLSGLYYFNSSLPGFSFFGKAGVANLSNDTVEQYEQDNDTQAFVGLGGEYQLDNKLSLRGEYEYFAEDASFMSVNLLVRFGEVPTQEVKVVERTIEVPVVPAPEGDGDGDGVVDSKDQCPNTPAGAKVDAQGCEFDLDADGVLNVDDMCPDTPRGMPVHSDGCPKFVGVLEGVQFELAKSTLTPNSKSILNGVARKLLSYPTLKVVVVGHTDSQGSDAYNNKLSLERAKAVAAYLTSQGVRGDRMKYAGYGERFPRADNTNAAGRAQNRRVELLPAK